MKLHELKPNEGSKKNRKRVGRGISAGQGKTAGRGMKGQNARAGGGTSLWHQGGNLPFFRRLPFKRGFTNINRVEYNEINLDQLEGLGNELRDMGVSSWTLEFPVPEGRMEENRELMPSPQEALPYFDMEWGLGPHESAEGYACGTHLANVEPGGRLIKCGYYREISGGDAGSGLRRAWRNLPKMRLEGVCAGCEVLSRCGGGCRYRADLMAGEGGPDPVMCARMGIAWG